MGFHQMPNVDLCNDLRNSDEDFAEERDRRLSNRQEQDQNRRRRRFLLFA